MSVIPMIPEKLYYKFGLHKSTMDMWHDFGIYEPEEEFKAIKIIDDILSSNFSKDEILLFMENFRLIDYDKTNIWRFVCVMERLIYDDMEDFVIYLFEKYFSKKILLHLVAAYPSIELYINKFLDPINNNAYTLDVYTYLIKYLEIRNFNVKLNININLINVQNDKELLLFNNMINMSEPEKINIEINHECYDKEKCNICNLDLGKLYLKAQNAIITAKNFSI